MKNIYLLQKLLKYISLIILLTVIALVSESQNVVITDDDSYTVDPSAMLDVKSLTGGLLIPRMTSTQRDAISDPAAGLMVYDLTLEKFYFYDGTNWNDLSAEGIWVLNANDLYPSNNDYKVGIGTSTPNSKLEVKADASFGDGDTLFVVKDNAGRPVFAVFPDGAVIYVDITKKGTVGGFAVSGRSPSKVDTDVNYFHVTPDSTRITFETTSYKGSVGGFAVSGRSPSKAGTSTTSLINLFPDNYFIGDSAGISTTATGLYNNFIGYKAGAKNTTGSNNTFMGYKSGYNNLGGYENLFLGLESGNNNLSGRSNLFIGNRSGFSNEDGYNNSFIGVNSGYSNTSGRYNVFIGDGSGYSHTTGWENVYIGMLAGYKGTGSIVGNVLMGSLAGYDNTSGGYNTYIGHHSGMYNTGSGNTFLGYSSGSSSNGHYNVFIGRMAGVGNTGSSNVLMGNLVARYLETGGGNTFLGTSAGQNLKTANNNVLIGYFAGGNKPDSIGDKNVFIGYQAGSKAYGSNQLYIENSLADSTSALIWGNFSSNILTFNANVGIGTTVPSDKLEVKNGNIRVTNGSFIDDGTTLNVPDYVFNNNYKIESIEEHAQFMWKEKHLPSLKSAKEINSGKGYNMAERREQMLEELEKAHVYIEQLNNEIKLLKIENRDLKKSNERISKLEKEILKIKELLKKE